MTNPPQKIMRILIVKVSSMGDVIHALPVVHDLKKNFPEIKIDWVVEEAFADIVRAHPDVSRVIPFALRRWKQQIFSVAHWREWFVCRRALQVHRYDAIFELQGLFKTALLANVACGTTFGLSASAAKEPASTRLLNHALPIHTQSHLVEQLRSIPAQALGYTVTGSPEFGLHLDTIAPTWQPEVSPYVVLLHMTAADYKLWDESAWIDLARGLIARGFTPVLPWGSTLERARAERIMSIANGATKHGAATRAIVAPRLSIMEWGKVMRGASLVIGVDTGLSHLAAALGVPSLFLFGATPRWRIAPYWGEQHVTLGEPGHWPSVGEVLQQAEGLLSRETT